MNEQDAPRKVIFVGGKCPGDLLMLSAFIRDLHKAYPGRFITDAHTACDEIFENSPYITRLGGNDPEAWAIDFRYDDELFFPDDEDSPWRFGIHRSNQRPYHFLHGTYDYLSRTLGVTVPITAFHGDIHLRDEERLWTNQVEQETGYNGDFWLINAGIKLDYTTKAWRFDWYQEVVDTLSATLGIQFVQVGEAGHYHPPLSNVINFVGRTDKRQFIRLMHHAQGVITPVSYPMHLAAAVETRRGDPPHRPCVVIAGGREPPQWEAYPHHRFLHTVGTMDCCDNGGCWKSRCQKVGDGDEKDDPENLCVRPVETPHRWQGTDERMKVPECMVNIRPQDVVDAVHSYFRNGLLKRKAIGATA